MRQHTCLFHYSQSVWRYGVNQCSLKMPYRNDVNVKEAVHCLLGLPFVPINDLLNVYRSIYRTCPASVVPLCLYVKKTYIRGARNGRPRYDPALWNVYELVLNKITKHLYL